MRRSTPSRRSHVASGRAGRPSSTSSRRCLRTLPSVLCDRDELVEGGRQLLLARPLEARAQDGHELTFWAAVHEDDEAKAELRFVRAVQLGKLRSLIGA